MTPNVLCDQFELDLRVDAAPVAEPAQAFGTRTCTLGCPHTVTCHC